MRIFEADGVKIVKLNKTEQNALETVAEIFSDLKDLDGKFYITDDMEDGGYELKCVINAVEGVDFTVLEED